MQLLIATGNKHKIDEIKLAIEEADLDIELVTPKEIGLDHLDPVEDSDTLEGNAEIKAIEFSNESGLPCIADDTGLEIEALDEKPGVYSARYAGENCSFEDNRNKVLKELGDTKNRKARFRTVICFVDRRNKSFVDGVCEGKITYEDKGQGGFGYDPIFTPNGYDRTFAEMSESEKNVISHRGRAVRNFVDWIKLSVLT